MTRRLLLAKRGGAFTLLILISGCGNSDLSRGKAKSLIEKSPLFTPATLQLEISPQEVRNGAREGMWSAHELRPGFWVDLYLTPKGKAFFSQAHGTTFTGGPAVTLEKKVPRGINGVTGITDGPTEMGPAGSVKRVLFTWEWDWNALPEEVRKCGCIGAKPPVSKGEILLKLYDDGWRVEGVW